MMPVRFRAELKPAEAPPFGAMVCMPNCAEGQCSNTTTLVRDPASNVNLLSEETNHD